MLLLLRLICNMRERKRERNRVHCRKLIPRHMIYLAQCNYNNFEETRIGNLDRISSESHHSNLIFVRFIDRFICFLSGYYFEFVIVKLSLLLILKYKILKYKIMECIFSIFITRIYGSIH